MRTAPPGPTTLAFATRSIRRFAPAAALPVVVGLLVNHADASGSVPHAVAPCVDLGASPIPGLYRVEVDTTAVPLGSRVDVLARATLGGRAVEFSWTWVVGDGEFVDAPPVAAPDPLAALSDDFNDSAIDPSWTIVADFATIVENTDGLVFFPAGSTGPGRAWGGDERGPIVSKPVTGDFRVTTDVAVTNTAGGDLPPLGGVDFHMAGLIVLDPRVDQVDAIDCGIGQWNNAYSFQTKSTVADFTTLYAANALSGGDTTGIVTPAYEITPVGSPTTLEARLRVSRVGQLFTVDVSYDGGASIAHTRTWDRTANPMAAEVQVGLMAFAAYVDPPDFQARFAGITFETL